MNANWTVTRAARSPRQPGPASMIVEEAFREALDRGWDEVGKQVFAEPFQGEEFVRFKDVSKNYGKVMDYPEMGGFTPMKRDADTPQMVHAGLGYPWEWRTYTFGNAVAFERIATELDEIGFTKGRQKELLNMHKRAVEFVIKDHFDRAFGLTGAPRLANDGCYYIDSDRPNPVPDGGTWSNLEAPAEISEDTLFAAYLNAAQQVSPTGNLYPQTILKLQIPTARKKCLWKVLETDRVLGSNHWDRNWANSGVFTMDSVVEYKYQEIDAIFYWLCDPKSEDNDLLLLRRKQPEITTEWGLYGGNPDVLGSRLRADWGVALGDVRKSIRGGLIVDES